MEEEEKGWRPKVGEGLLTPWYRPKWKAAVLQVSGQFLCIDPNDKRIDLFVH